MPKHLTEFNLITTYLTLLTYKFFYSLTKSEVYYKIVSTFIFLYNDSDAKSLESIKTTFAQTKVQAPDAKYILIGINTSNTPESKVMLFQ